MGSFTYSEDPDEMPHNVAFHQGLYCLLRSYLQKSENYDTLRYVQWTMPGLLHQTRRKNPFVYKELKCLVNLQ